MIVSAIGWLLALAAGLLVIAAWQCLQLYVRRRWQSRISLPDPVAFTDRPSYPSDHELILRIHSSKPVQVRFLRCDGDGFVETHIANAAATLQSPVIDHWHGCDWTPTIVLPADTLTAGFYRIEVCHQDQPSRHWSMCLLVRSTRRQPVVVVAPTNTWSAYNDFGGLSNYRDRATPLPLRPIRAVMRWFNMRPRIADRHWLLAVPLPDRRPNASLHRHLNGDNVEWADIRGEAALVRFLERERAPYMIVSDRDFVYDIDASRARLVVFSTHSEYWSDEMIARLGELIERGVNIAFLSGNNLFRKVQLLQSGLSVIDLMIPQHQVVPMIGTYSDAYGWRTYAPYRVTDPDHWCFEGLHVHAGSEFGAACNRGWGASGHETDKIRPGAVGFQVVAIGSNSEGPAFMVCRDLPGGNFVFNASSISFTSCLDDDPVIQGLVRNILARGVGAMREPDDGAAVSLLERRHG